MEDRKSTGIYQVSVEGFRYRPDGQDASAQYYYEDHDTLKEAMKAARSLAKDPCRVLEHLGCPLRSKDRLGSISLLFTDRARARKDRIPAGKIETVRENPRDPLYRYTTHVLGEPVRSLANP
ncbi:MAG TPA: hypothetical protein PKX87_08985 [Alphaproteobacteria bacterium]|nr:hypothetical protein [Alphaproteobacteria bacterium]